MKTSLLLSAWRLLSAAMGVPGPLYLYWQGQLGRDDFSRRNERLARSYIHRPGGRLALLHTASGPEALVLAPLAKMLGQLGFGVLVSVRDPGGLHVPQFPPALHQLSPLDTPQHVRRFLDHWRPGIVMICGAEIPPNLIIETSRRGIALALIDAWMPAKKFLLWRRIPSFAAALLSRIDLCLAQTQAGAARFRALGATSVRAAGSLKYDAAPALVDEFALARLSARIGTRPAWVADGIAPGESEIVLAAHCQLARHFPDVLTIILPGDPWHAPEIAQLAGKKELVAGFRGPDAETAPFPQIYIAHPAEEPGVFYRGAGVVFAGQSLRGGGGKNPVHAARPGCAILHGPEVGEFEDFFVALDNCGGGTLVLDADSLAKELALLFFDKAELRAMARAAALAAADFSGASARIIQAIAPYIAQTMVAPNSAQ